MTRPLDSEALLAHSGWVWRLARSLVADDPTADDVLQDTMVAALERSPKSDQPGASLRAWLSTVARHFALRQRRTDSRRDERERRAARPIELPPADRVLERESARRDLVEHVLALDDAYRDTILLRYFDELPPIEIARRLGVPDSTVRNRLRRGLSQLHDRLERERGEEWKQWCLLLAPVGSGGTHAPLFSLSGWPAGLLAMGTKLVLLLVALFGAVATIFSWHALHGEGDATRAVPAIVRNAEQPAAVVDRSSAEVANSRDAIIQGPRVPEALAKSMEPIGILCFGTVRNRKGVVVTSGSISIEDPIGRRRDCRLDERGWYSFAGLAPGRWTLRAWCDGFRSFDATADLKADASTDRRDLVLDAATLINVRIRTTSKEPPAADGRTNWARSQIPWAVVATRNAPPSTLGETTQRRHFVYGIGKYRAREPFGGRDTLIAEGYDGVLEVSEPLPCYVSLALRHIVVETKMVPAGASDVEFVVDSDSGTRLLAHARVRVVDAESGTPIPGARVALNSSDTGGGGLDTDEEGVARLDDLLPGPLTLSVNKKDYAWFERVVEIESEQMNDLATVRMRRSCRVIGKVVDESGSPVSIGLSWLDGEAVDRPDRFRSYSGFRSDSTGRFECEAIPRGRLLLCTAPHDDGWAHTCVVVDTSGGDLENVVLRVGHGHAVGLEIESADIQQLGWVVRRPDGVPVASSDWVGRGPAPLQLEDGAYRIEVWRDGSLARTQDLHVSRDGELFRVKL